MRAAPRYITLRKTKTQCPRRTHDSVCGRSPRAISRIGSRARALRDRARKRERERERERDARTYTHTHTYAHTHARARTSRTHSHIYTHAVHLLSASATQCNLRDQSVLKICCSLWRTLANASMIACHNQLGERTRAHANAHAQLCTRLQEHAHATMIRIAVGHTMASGAALALDLRMVSVAFSTTLCAAALLALNQLYILLERGNAVPSIRARCCASDWRRCPLVVLTRTNGHRREPAPVRAPVQLNAAVQTRASHARCASGEYCLQC